MPRRPGLRFGPNTWRAGVPEEVAADPEQRVGPHLIEQEDYALFVRGRTGARLELRHRDPTLIADVSASDGGAVLHGMVNFRSQIGRSEFSLFVDGTPEFDFEVEVFPSKLDYASDYERLTAEVQDVLTGLAVEYLRSTFQLGSAVSSTQSTHVEWLSLLRGVAGELERAVLQIERSPHRALSRDSRLVRAERLRKTDQSVRRAVQLGRGVGPMRRLASGQAVRSRLVELRPEPTLDTAEHRWIAGQLARIRRRLADIRETEVGHANREQFQSDRSERILAEIDSLEAQIVRLERTRPMAEAVGPPPVGFSSLQLLMAPGYREAYRACLILSFGLRITGGPMRLSVKDLHLLYEYWCYLAVLRLVSEETGQPLQARDLLEVEQDGLRVRIQKGREHSVSFDGVAGRRITVTYNPRFAGRSMLTAQQPDIILSFEDPGWPKVRLVLDAKYRIDTTESYRNRYRTAGPPDDAINVLHRYRDAILDTDPDGHREAPKRTVIEGAVLFPLQEVSPGDYRSSRLWEALGRFGIGAVPFLPGQTAYCRDWLRSLLARGGWAVAERAVSHRSQDQMRDWRTAAAEPVVVGVLRGSKPDQHLEWIRSTRSYYVPETKTQQRQYATRWVALYVPGTMRDHGAVTLVAEVQTIEIVPRGAIPTPWPASRPDERQVLYRLGELREMSTPVENRARRGRRSRFSTPRWTSRLGLERATELRELFLETEPEWRLYEDLQAAGIPFEIEPGKVKLNDPQDPSGRAAFVTSAGTVKYYGAGGFGLTVESGVQEFFSQTAGAIDRIRIPTV